jgi:hypothetical protein
MKPQQFPPIMVAIIALAALPAPPCAAETPAPASPAAADAPAMSPADAAKTFDAAWGARMAQVGATRDAADDAALARDLLAAAEAAATPPALVPLALEKAWELGIRAAEGCPAAIRAMTLLADRAPEARDAAQDKLIEAHQAHYSKTRGVDKVRAGEALVQALVAVADERSSRREFEQAAALYRRALPLAATLRAVNQEEVKSRLEYAQTRQGFLAQAERLQAILKQDPKDQAARDDLVRIYVVEFDDPAAAARHINLEGDSLNSKLVLLAGMSPERLPQRAAIELADWYRALAEKSSSQGRLIALLRARTYLRQYLSAEGGDRRDPATKALDEVNAALAQVVVAQPRLEVMTAAEFQSRYAALLAPAANVAGTGRAQASSHWGNREPQRIFAGRRTGDAWSLNGPKGGLEARWSPPVLGQVILLFGRDGATGSDAWGEASIAVNGAKPRRVDGMASGCVLLADLGIDVPISSVRVEINGSTYPGLAGLEIHPRFAAHSPAAVGDATGPDVSPLLSQ